MHPPLPWPNSSYVPVLYYMCIYVLYVPPEDMCLYSDMHINAANAVILSQLIIY